MEELVAEGKKLPIGGRVAIDRRRMLDLIDQMRVAAPMELRQAQEILGQKEEVLLRAREEAQLQVAQAEQEVQLRLADSEVVKAAEAKAQELLRQAEEQAESMLRETEDHIRARANAAEAVAAQQMEEADRYAMEMLHKLEAQLSAFLGSVRAGIDSMEEKTSENVR
jgi:hypothetical protein